MSLMGLKSRPAFLLEAPAKNPSPWLFQLRKTCLDTRPLFPSSKHIAPTSAPIMSPTLPLVACLPLMRTP